MPQRTFAVQIKGEDKLKQNIAYLRRNFPEWLAEANNETGDEIAALAKSNIKTIDAFDTGELYESIEKRSSPKGLSVSVGSTAKHAPYIEFGTAPHFPPVDKIRAWCLRKGLPASAAYPIARKISERGTPERPFLYPAYLVGMRNHITRVRKHVLTALGRVLTA